MKKPGFVYDRVTRNLMRNRAKSLRKNRTIPEQKLESILRERKEGRILRQKVVGKIIVDLALPFRNLLIEIDGISHAFKKDQDKRRDLFVSSLGFNILRVTNDQVLYSINYVLKEIDKFPKLYSNREIFFKSIRDARKKSYWVKI